MKFPHWLTHHWSNWEKVVNKKYELMGTGLFGKFDPEHLKGKWVPTQQIFQRRVCKTCGLEQRSLL